jgi:hypothetical protein
MHLEQCFPTGWSITNSNANKKNEFVSEANKKPEP